MSQPTPQQPAPDTAAAPRRSPKQWLHDLSLTTRLVAVVVTLALVAFTVTTAITVSLMRDYLLSQVDSDLQSLAQTAAQLAPSRGSGQIENVLFASGERYAVIILEDGLAPAPYHLTPSGAQRRMPAWEGVDWTSVGTGDAITIPGVDAEQNPEPGTEWRMVAQPLQNRSGTVLFGTTLDRVNRISTQLTLLSTIVGLAVMITVALLSWFAVRRAFRPLTRIEDTAKSIAAGDLTRRVPQRHGKDEVASLAASLNIMLAKIEQAFAVRAASESRMRQFVADASHELRTPLATVRGYAELYRVGGITKEADVASAMRRIENEATRMTRLVEDLLLLTRLDSQRDRQLSVVDLTVLVADTVQDARVRAPGRTIRMLWPGGHTGPIRTAGDDHALRQVLANLVGNALTYTPEDTAIEVALAPVGSSVMIEVRDHGPGIPAELAPRVFERFFRADPSRSREKGGTGLGLAIVAAIVGSHGGRVRLVDTPGGGATFRVELPALHPASGEVLVRTRPAPSGQQSPASSPAATSQTRQPPSAKSQEHPSTPGD